MIHEQIYRIQQKIPIIKIGIFRIIAQSRIGITPHTALRENFFV